TKTVTFDFVENAYEMTRYSGNVTDYNAVGMVLAEKDGVTLTNGDKVDAKNKPNGTRLWGDGLRVYSEGSIIVTATDATVDKVEITTKTAANAEKNFNITYADGAATVARIITYNDKGNPSGNDAVKTMTVTYTTKAAADVEPTQVPVKISATAVGGTAVWGELPSTDEGLLVTADPNATSVAVTLDVPAGFTGFAIISDDSYDEEIEGLSTRAIEWVALSDFQAMGINPILGNSFTVNKAAEYMTYSAFPMYKDKIAYEFYPITVHFANDVTSGVEAIEAEGVAEYYNLQGVKVANPENGIFVKVVNGKASKVVL
ncbi:MAG: hypothetical protein K2F64_01545, partial [Muribaculaceae bacterium]|nr:hypothetical protein [Muribaculaceae bacterium]